VVTSHLKSLTTSKLCAYTAICSTILLVFMAYARAQHTQKHQIPVVDLSNLQNGQNPQTVAKALHAASQNLGFIYVSAHGIPDNVIKQARTAAFRFFKQPDNVKADVLISPQHRGWLKPGASKMQQDAKADLKESFVWGHQNSSEDTPPNDHPLRGS